MLTFFRRIRKGLLGEGVTSKYLLYAVGEILLVMIGILLALQVNNWNEWRKDRIVEKKILSEVKNTIEMNCQLFLNHRTTINDLNNSNDTIISFLENKQSFSSLFQRHFERSFRSGTNIYMSFSGYEGLRNVGFGIIQSDTLKNEIINLFDVLM